MEAPHVTADLQPAAEIRAAVLLTQAVVPGSSSAAPMQTTAANISPIHGQSLQPIFEQEEDETQTEGQLKTNL